MRISKTTALLLSLSTTSFAKTFSKSKDAVLLSNVRSLTLQADKPTSHRRVSSIPQLTCTGGNAKSLYNVDVMRCTNSGSEYDAEDIQWTCHASLPPEFKLGSTEVVCEGYDSPDDPYVLKGSCGVEYRLILTDLGEAKYAGRSFDTHSSKFGSSRSGITGLVNKFWNLLFWTVFIAVVCIILYKVFFPERRMALPNLGLGGGGGWGGGGGGGGGGGYNDDPPPPYTPRAPPRPKSNTTPRSAPRTSSRTQPSSGPGFWSGAATGGAAGYGAGYFMGQRSRERERERSRERQRERERERERSSWFGSPSSSSSTRSGFLGGGGGGSGSAGSSSAPGPSSSRYESTGFGGTRRR